MQQGYHGTFHEKVDLNEDVSRTTISPDTRFFVFYETSEGVIESLVGRLEDGKISEEFSEQIQKTDRKILESNLEKLTEVVVNPSEVLK